MVPSLTGLLKYSACALLVEMLDRTVSILSFTRNCIHGSPCSQLRNGSGTMTPATALTAADGPLRKPGTGWHAYALRSTAPKMVIRCLNKMLGAKAFDPGILNNCYIKKHMRNGIIYFHHSHVFFILMHFLFYTVFLMVSTKFLFAMPVSK